VEADEKLQERIAKHPCYNEEAHHHYARMHVAVAPACNIQCNYCNRKYDCANESRPGVVSELPFPGEKKAQQITILASSALTPGDVQQLKEIVTAFGLTPIVVPDLSASLDGHLDDSYSPITGGGTTLVQLRKLGSSAFTLALGESMHGAAKILQQRLGTPFEVFTELTGLEPTDRLLQFLMELSGTSVPEQYRRQRRQLQDAMLDTHFYFGRKQVSLALEPDLLWSTVCLLQSMGAQIQAAVTTTRSPLLEKLPLDKVVIGDLEDFEQLAAGSDLLIGNSHVAAIASKLGIPLYRQGIPIFDRLGNGQFTKVGYKGTMQMLFDIGNLFLEAEEVKARDRNIHLDW
jgi:nitrogenase molybdenum-iron protein NifN